MSLEYTKQQLNSAIQATIKIPYHLRSITENQSLINISLNEDLKTVKSVLKELFNKYPALANSILDEEGNIARVISLYINDENIKKLNNLNTKLEPGQNEITFRAGIAGG